MTQYFYEQSGKGNFVVYASKFGANKTIVDTATTKRGALAIIDRLNKAAQEASK